MISFFFVPQPHANEHRREWKSPSDEHVLQTAKYAIFLDHERHNGVSMQAFQEHEHESGREEEVNENTEDAAHLKNGIKSECNT